MIFWLFIICLVVGVICIIVANLIDVHTRYDVDWFIACGCVLTGVATFAVIICTGIIIAQYSTADAYVASNHEKYESLTYQLENDLYDNDNDIGKKALYDEIREWNEDLAYYQSVQDSFWLGIFYPNVFDEFEFISYDRERRQ